MEKKRTKVEKKNENIWWNAYILHSKSNQMAGGWRKCFFVLSYRGCACAHVDKVIQSFSSSFGSSELCAAEVSTSATLPRGGQI